MTALDTREAAALAEYEAAVERGLSTFLDVGRALLAIRDDRLYRAGFSTFGAYCVERWGFTDRRARQLIAAAEIGTTVPVRNEAQARELAGLNAEGAQAVYDIAMAHAMLARGTKEPTADELRQARAGLERPRSIPEPLSHDEARALTDEIRAGAGLPPHPQPPRPQPSPPSVDSTPPDGGEPTSVLSPPAWAETPTEKALTDDEPPSDVLDGQLEDELSSTDDRFRSNLVKACAPNYSVLDLPVHRVVETYLPGSNAAEALDLYLTRMTAWIDDVRAGLRPAPSLRSIR